MHKQHLYNLTVEWTGNKGQGTSDYRSYERSHKVIIDNKTEIQCSSDPAFRGESTKHNPEELFVAAISTCHMLWYLHLCAEAGVIVIAYTDNATGILQETEDGGGHFTNVTLNPQVIVSDKSMIERANELHQNANKLCFIANSCNFPIHHNPTCKINA
ncbi:MAG: OsmC family protein [Bacteroidota bacterium]